MSNTAVSPLAPAHSANKQLALAINSSRPVNSYSQAAVYIGDFFEELAANLLGAKRLRTLARHFCPDLRQGNVLFECKAMRHRGETLLTADQIAKYESAKAEFKIVYVFSIHSAKAQEIDRRETLFDTLARGVEAVYLVDAAIVHTLTETRGIEANNARYKPFVRCRHTDLKKWFRLFGQGMTYGIGLEAKEREIEPFPVYLASSYAGQLAYMKGKP